MTELGWRHACASAIGSSHVRTGVLCQDACRCQTISTSDQGELIVAAAADGAGSAVKGEIGAKIACDTFTEMFRTFLSDDPVDKISSDHFRRWLDYFRSRIELTLSAEPERSLRDYACTFIGAIASPELALFCQIGDGAIVYSCRESTQDFACAFLPSKGEYANETSFITDDSAFINEGFRRHTGVTHFALLTDGLERLALVLPAYTPFGPFFQGMFESLAASKSLPQSDLDCALQNMLSSQEINERSDDDKTLVLASLHRRDR